MILFLPLENMFGRLLQELLFLQELLHALIQRDIRISLTLLIVSYSIFNFIENFIKISLALFFSNFCFKFLDSLIKPSIIDCVQIMEKRLNIDKCVKLFEDFEDFVKSCFFRFRLCLEFSS